MMSYRNPILKFTVNIPVNLGHTTKIFMTISFPLFLLKGFSKYLKVIGEIMFLKSMEI